MSEKTKKFENELGTLIRKGELLQRALLNENYKEEYEKAIDKDKSVELPDFRADYQSWYSEALALIKQVLPDRLKDFISHYEYSRVRKNITYENYMIRDYLQGLVVTRGYAKNVVVDGTSAIPEFEQQLNIVKAARATLGSALVDITSILQADLFDSEIDSARGLAKSGFLRAAGAMCGVVIEKHLKQVCDTHAITLKKKSPGISDFNQNLREKEIISVPQWRFIQHLSDIRNICDHAKDREPKKTEIDDLLSGTEKVLKTVF